MKNPQDSIARVGAISPQYKRLTEAEIDKYIDYGKTYARLIHDISNPLTAALVLMQSQIETGKVQTAEIYRNLVLIEGFITSARSKLSGRDNLIYFDIRRYMQQIVLALEPISKARGVQLTLGRLPALSLFGDPVIFQRILTNLIMNSIESYEGSGKKYKSVLIDVIRFDQKVIIRVTDRGAGVKQQHKSRLFDEFFSTKSSKNTNLGLGLNQVKQYIEEDFSGSISCRSSAKHGTCFQISISIPKTID